MITILVSLKVWWIRLAAVLPWKPSSAVPSWIRLAAWSWDGLAAGSLLFKCFDLLARSCSRGRARRLFACLPSVGFRWEL